MKKYVNGMKRSIDEGKSIRKERKENRVKNVEIYIHRYIEMEMEGHGMSRMISEKLKKKKEGRGRYRTRLKKSVKK